MRNILETEDEKSQYHRRERETENKNQIGKIICYENTVEAELVQKNKE